MNTTRCGSKRGKKDGRKKLWGRKWVLWPFLNPPLVEGALSVRRAVGMQADGQRVTPDPGHRPEASRAPTIL